MNDTQIGIIKTLVKKDNGAFVLWSPDEKTSRIVVRVGPHAGEGDDEPCGVFANGEYVALYNCEWRDFLIAMKIPESEIPLRNLLG